MRKPLSLCVVLLCLMMPARGAELTSLERQRLVAHMEMTASWLEDEVSGLSRPQLEFRPADGAWNILEVLDHLVVVGPIYWDDLQRAVQGPASSRALAGRDDDILWYGIDRTNRERAIPSENPQRLVRDVRTGLDAYRKHHARLLEYVRTTKDDLRSRLVPRQGSDAYQWALLISTHEMRHILQVREIKAHPRFPKN
jgi:hypothetical protein